MEEIISITLFLFFLNQNYFKFLNRTQYIPSEKGLPSSPSAEALRGMSPLLLMMQFLLQAIDSMSLIWGSICSYETRSI